MRTLHHLKAFEEFCEIFQAKEYTARLSFSLIKR